jgi:hypothetical protein
LFGRLDDFAISYLDGGATGSGADVEAVWFGGGVEVMAGSASIDDGGVVGVVCGWGDWRFGSY